MTSLSQDIKNKLSNLNVLEKIIVLNLVTFVLGLLLSTGFSWFTLPASFPTLWLNLGL